MVLLPLSDVALLRVEVFDYWHDDKQGRLDHATFVIWLAPVRQQLEATLEDSLFGAAVA